MTESLICWNHIELTSELVWFRWLMTWVFIFVTAPLCCDSKSAVDNISDKAPLLSAWFSLKLNLLISAANRIFSGQSI